ncbi:thiamine pyrophosphate-binding protein [Salipiger abyssi]|uniref:thiamine pyrophosphate-binding protein n=1 Tax=Salipiger abyssi TaxID=1250539 RepID=UPI004059609C
MNDTPKHPPQLRYPAKQVGDGLYGSDHVVDLLERMGTEYVFINPGSSFRGIHDSLVNYNGNRDPEICLVTHEMIAIAMAHGYWKATRKPAVAILHNLVGLMSGSMAIFNAFCDQVPLLILGGSGPADPEQRRFIDWAHSANTQGDLVRPYVKWTDEPPTIAATLESMLTAHRKALTAPMGPTYVSIDAGHQEQRADDLVLPDPELPRYQAPHAVYPHPELVRQAADLLLGAELPLIIGGQFGTEARVTPPLARLVELLGAAYIDDRSIVCLATDHPQNLSGDREIRSRADVLLCLDCRDVTAATGGYGAKRSGIMGVGSAADEAKVIDVSLNDHFGNSWSRFGGPTAPSDLHLLSDPFLTLEALVTEVEARLTPEVAATAETRRAELAIRKTALTEKRAKALESRWSESPIPLSRVTQEVYQAVKQDDWCLVVRNHRTWPEGYWKFDHAGQYLGGDGGGGVGYGAGAAVGAALGLKGSGKLPVAMIGDGDFMMTPGALWSAMHHEVPLLLVLLNNRSWGNDELHQREIAHQRGRSAATAHIGQTTRDPDVDLTSLARSFGAFAEGPVEEGARLADVLAEAAEHVRKGGLAVVEVITALE